MQIGIDILDIDRIIKLVDKKTFYAKFFTNTEIEMFEALEKQRKVQVVAGHYSAKEAFLKACGIGIGRGIDLKDISILYDDLGRPYIELTDEGKKFFNDLKFTKSTLNISDSKNIVVAVCIVY